MRQKRSRKPRRIYFIEEEEGKDLFYVYYVGIGPVKTLFDVCHSRELAKKAIKDHRVGKHPTQDWPGK